MLEVQPKDERDYFMLPQAPEDAGYYVYGTPTNGAGQFSHPACYRYFFSWSGSGKPSIIGSSA